MAKLDSTIEVHSEEFIHNSSQMQELVDAFRAVEQKVVDKENEASEKFKNKGKLLPRQRMNMLLDRGTPFLEISSLAGYKMHDDKDGALAGGGVIAGIGYVSGIRCLIVASNSAIKGGTISPAGLDKTLRLQEIAKQNKLPVVTLAESGGANLNYATDIFILGAKCFANQARLSASGIPQITVVHGNATAGGAYQPGLSDYCIMVKGQAKMFLAGPPLLKAATGEIASDEELGGAEMHTEGPGSGDFLAVDDADAIRQARDIMSVLPWNEQLPKIDKPKWEEPLFSPDELIGIVPSDSKRPYDVREIIARIADSSKFVDFKPEYDTQTVCVFLKIQGHACGLIGNNGPITSDGACKAAQFIHLCEQSNSSLLFFQNTTGFMVGTHAEQHGIIKHGSKLLQAVANTSVEKITIVVGGSYGAGNYAMCGRGLDPHFIFAWPNSRTSVMGGAQAGKVLRIVTEDKHAKMGKEADPKMLDMIEKATADKLDEGSAALFGTARLWDDGLIDPRDTRKILAFLLDICHEARVRTLKSTSFGVARF